MFKKFRANPVFDLSLNPVPENLKKSLDLISRSYNSSRMRNLEIMNTEESRLYGFMTNYEGANYCWVQPTRVKSNVPEVEYDKYIRRINRDARENKLNRLREISVGTDCIACYEADNHWYRAMIVGEPINDEWLVLFVDYGNFQRCHEHLLARPIHEPQCDHFHAPLQAVCCRLYNIVPRLPSLRNEIDNKLEAFYTKHSSDFLEILVRNVRPDYVIDCDIFLCKRGAIGENRLFKRHVGQELVESGLATFADPQAAHCFLVNPTPPNSQICITIDDEEDDKKPLMEIFKSENRVGG